MRLNGKINKRGDVLRLSHAVYKWCADNIGYGRKRYVPILVVERWNSTEYDEGEVGWYSDGVIHIAYDRVKTVEETVRTVIHEWTHYTQTRKVVRYVEGIPYHEQQCEIEAFRNESALYKTCWAGIRGKFKSLKNQ